MFTHTITRQLTDGGNQVSAIETVEAEGRKSVDVNVPDSSTDLQVEVVIDVSTVKSIYIKSDQDVTIETNDGTTPADTLAIKANAPYVWTENSVDSLALGTDVTDLFITNASGSAARVQLEALVDPTP